MKARLESFVTGVLERLGFRIEPWRPHRYPESRKGVTRWVDLEREFGKVPGMVSSRSGFKLYLLAMSQSISGDLIEIGCWMGRSTCYLARACRDRGESHLFAIDHFEGNPGKETHYGLDRISPTDIRDAFWRHLKAAGLEEQVTLHDAPSEDVVERVREGADGVRLLFIDGDHRYPAVARDLELYGALVEAGGLLVLDDYADAFPGVVRAAEEYVIDSPRWSHAVQWENMLLARRISHD